MVIQPGIRENIHHDTTLQAVTDELMPRLDPVSPSESHPAPDFDTKAVVKSQTHRDAQTLLSINREKDKLIANKKVTALETIQEP